MSWLSAGIKWIMLASGVLTCTMFYAAISPRAALQSSFGDSLEGPVAEIVVRNWGALIGLIGLLLIYGAFRPAVRFVALGMATASKIVFISLVLLIGRPFLAHQVGVSVAVDSLMVILFCLYMFSANGRATIQDG